MGSWEEMSSGSSYAAIFPSSSSLFLVLMHEVTNCLNLACFADKAMVLKHHPDKRKAAGEPIKEGDNDYFTCITKGKKILLESGISNSGDVY